MKKIVQKYNYQIWAFLIAVIPRMILSLFAYPIRTMSDELGTISNGAFLAGLDWSAVASESGYYGSGLSLFFAPFIRYIDDPVLLYRVMLLVICLLYGIVALICFYIMRNIMGMKDNKYCCLVSVTCTYVVAVRAMVVYNEHMLTVISWMIALLLLKAYQMVSTGKSNIKVTIMITSILAYALIVHTRSVIFIASVLAVVLFVRLYYKKWLLSMPVFLFEGILLGGAARYFNAYMKENIWVNAGTESIRNAEIQTSGVMELLQPRTWHAWGNIILGQIQTINVLTCGVFLFSCVLFICLLWKCIRNYKLKKLHNLRLGREGYTFTVGIFCLVGVGITILGQIATWGVWATDGMSLGLPSPSYGIKAFTYIRYFIIFCGPMVMMFFVWIHDQKDWFGKHIKILFAIFAGIQFYWFCAVIPYIYKNGSLIEVFIPFSLWNATRGLGIGVFLPATFVCLLVMVGFWWCYKKGKIYIPVIVVGVLLMFQYFYNGVIWDYSNSEKNYVKSDAGYRLIEQLEEICDLPNDIYVYDESGMSDHQNYFIYQFMLKEYQVIPGVPESETTEAIIFSNTILSDEQFIVNEGYEMSQLDNNEYVYVKGKPLQEAMEKCGINLKNYNSYIYEGAFEGKLPLKLRQGEYHFSLFLDGLSVCQNSNIVLKNEQEEIIYSQSIDTNDVGADNEIQVEMDISLQESEQIVLEIVASGSDGNEIVNQAAVCKRFYYERIYDGYVAGLGYESEVSHIAEKIKEMQGVTKISYLSKNYVNPEHISLELWKNELSNVSLIPDKIKDGENMDSEVVILEKDAPIAFSLIDRYTIVGKTDNYLLMVNNHCVEWIDYFLNLGEVYSSQDGIELSALFTEAQTKGYQKITLDMNGCFEINADLILDRNDMSKFYSVASDGVEDIEVAQENIEENKFRINFMTVSMDEKNPCEFELMRYAGCDLEKMWIRPLPYAKFVNILFQKALGRPVGENDLRVFCGRLNDGTMTTKEFLETIFYSQEYQEKSYNNDKFIEIVLEVADEYREVPAEWNETLKTYSIDEVLNWLEKTIDRS